MKNIKNIIIVVIYFKITFVCQNTLAEGKKVSAKQSCVNDICGVNSFDWNQLRQKTDKEITSGKYFDLASLFMSKLNSTVLSLSKLNSVLYKKRLSYINSNPKLTNLDENSKRIINALFFIQNYNEFESNEDELVLDILLKKKTSESVIKDVNNMQPSLKIGKRRSNEYFGETLIMQYGEMLKENDPKWFSKASEYFFKQKAVKKYYYLSTYISSYGDSIGIKHYYNMLSPEKSYTEALRQDVKDSVRKFESIKNKMGKRAFSLPYMDAFGEKGLITKISNNEDLPSSQISIISQILFYVSLYAQVLEDKPEFLLLRPVNQLSDFIIVDKTKNELEEAIKLFDSFIRNPNIRESEPMKLVPQNFVENNNILIEHEGSQKKVSEFEYNFMFNYALSMNTDNQRESLENLKKTILEKVRKSVLKLFSDSQTKELVNKIIDGIEFQNPGLKSKYKLNFEKKINLLEKFYQSELSNLNNGFNNDDLVFQILTNKKMYSSLLSNLIEDYTGRINYLSDRAYTLLGKIILSPAVYLDKITGSSIIAHEIGHVVSTGLMDKMETTNSILVFKEVRECLAQNHPNTIKTKVEKMKNGSEFTVNQYTEEDWADFIAGISLMDTESSRKGSMCGLLVNLNNEERFHFENTNEEDSHSSGFYRTLYVEKLVTGKLPKTCESVIKDSKYLNANWKTCLPKSFQK